MRGLFSFSGTRMPSCRQTPALIRSGPQLTVASILRGVLVSLLAVAVAGAQEAETGPEEYSEARILELEATLADLAAGEKLPVPDDPAEQGVFVIVEGSAVGRNHFDALGGRSFLVVKLVVMNQTSQPVSFPAASLSVAVNGRQIAHSAYPSSARAVNVRINGRLLQKDDIETPETVEVAAGSAKQVFGTFLNLPDTGTFRSATVTVGGLSQPVRCDLLKRAARELDLKIERIGPRDCLGILTIEGRLATVSAHLLVAEIDRVLSRGASRILIRWGTLAERIDVTARSWLGAAANRSANIGFSSQMTYPSMPTALAELHLGPFPRSAVSGSAPPDPTRRLHASDRDAIAGALLSVYRQLPVDEVVADIRKGDQRLRYAALRGGAGRLPSELIPDLLEISASEDTDDQSAAIAALSDFPDEAAIGRLTELASSEQSSVVKAATQGLASSRFPVAQRKLAELLQTISPASRLRIARVLVEEPHPAWRDVYYAYASDSSSSLTLKAMRALRQVGHPDLRGLLTRALRDANDGIAREAFQQLAGSSDLADQQTAIEHSLRFIQEEMPTSEMLDLLQRVGCREATPHLIRHYESGTAQQKRVLLSAIIKTGDESIVPFLREQFENGSDDRERSILLTALATFHPPGLRRMAIESLRSQDSALVMSACRLLQDDGSDAAVAAIGDQLIRIADDARQDGPANTMIRALGSIATPKARAYLRRVENGKSRNRRQWAASTLIQLYRASPALVLLNEAAALREEGKIEEAEKKYNKAIEIDGFLPEIYIRRGHLKSHSGRRDQAIADFDLALEIDPLHPIATSLKAIAIVVVRDVDAGLKMVEDNADVFRYDDVFNYNAACAYGQALRVTRPTPENLEKIAAWKSRTLDFLEHCIDELRYDDFKLLKSDPDLDPVRDTDRFRALLQKIEPLEEPDDEEDRG